MKMKFSDNSNNTENTEKTNPMMENDNGNQETSKEVDKKGMQVNPKECKHCETCPVCGQEIPPKQGMDHNIMGDNEADEDFDNPENGMSDDGPQTIIQIKTDKPVNWKKLVQSGGAEELMNNVKKILA